MVNYISTISKYFITIFILLYTLECFLVFKYKNEKARKGIYTRQVVLIVLIHFSCFVSLCLKSGNIDYLLFYILFQFVVLSIIIIIPMVYRRINRLLINNSAMLISVGLIMLVRLDMQEAFKQMVIMIISFVIAGFIPFLMKKYKELPNYPFTYAVTGIVMLMLVYTLGSVFNGSKLSLNILGLSFMPSEFVKILFVFFLAGMLYQNVNIKTLMITTGLAAAHVLILALSTDLGAALILFVVYVIMVFIATRNYWYLLLGTSVGAGVSVLAYHLFRHVKVRVAAFIDPFSVIDNEGYQITQSLFAISSGNWFGLGLFEGTPETIPYVETDFIFSAISQELGIVFSICVILICISCFIMFINISLKFTNNFYRLIAVGLAVSYIFQVFLTIGGGTKFIPLTGVTLPLISYGGSSVLATTIVFFIIEGLYVIKPKKTQNDNLEFKLLKPQTDIVMGIMYFFCALFLSLIIYLIIYVSKNNEELINNAYNPRQEVLIEHNVRGSIYSRDYQILAKTDVDLNKKETRVYPFYNIFSHVVGYASKGRSGIEGQANYYLINSNQPLSERMAADITNNKYLADSVVTTLDVDLQKIAYTAIGTYDGAVVVSNPKTGEVYGMVSKPDFDPNEIDDIWDDLVKDNESSVLLNRATQGLYPPGSTFKIVTLLEYVRENPLTYNDYSFRCKGSLKVEDGSVICYNHTAHGSMNLASSLAVSCNSSFGNIGLKLDRNKFQDTLDGLLFNKELPLTMNYSQSVANSSDDLSELDMVYTAFGQGGTLMTPMHLNLITSAIANDGVLMKPYLISEVINSNMNTVKKFSSEKYATLMTKEEADILTDMMTLVVEDGTGKNLRNNTYTVAGKTGSAEFSDYSKNTHSWFTGFAPAEDPEICVTIILEEAGTSGLHAVPMAKKIFDVYFRNKYNGISSEIIEE